MTARPWPGACAALVATLVSGVTQLARAESAAATSSALTGQIVSLVMGMAVVLAVIAAVAWLMKRIAPRNYSNAGVLRVIAGTAVGQRERVVVVEIGATWLVLGVTPGSVTALHQLPRLTAAEPAAATTGEQRPFAAWFKHMLEKRGER
jgi:flagellar protein FliO/FliZ